MCVVCIIHLCRSAVVFQQEHRGPLAQNDGADAAVAYKSTCVHVQHKCNCSFDQPAFECILFHSPQDFFWSKLISCYLHAPFWRPGASARPGSSEIPNLPVFKKILTCFSSPSLLCEHICKHLQVLNPPDLAIELLQFLTQNLDI